MIGERALIIDDEADIQEAIKFYLEPHFKQNVQTAASVVDATQLLQKEKYDLITLDINLTGGNGAALVKFMTEQENPNKDTPVIVCSAYINEAFEEKFRHRFLGILVKPFTSNEIENILKKIEIKTPLVFELTEAQNKIKESVEKAKKLPKLKEYLKSVKIDKTLPKDESHTELLKAISSGLARECGWSSDAALSKIMWACHYHDLSIAHLPELTTFWDRIELELQKEKLSPEEYELVRQHPITSCQELEKHPKEIDEESITLIKQHHERPDGTGFPNGLKGSKIGPLSSLFITAHDLSTFIVRNPNQWSVAKYLEKRKSKLAGPHFQKLFDLLETLKK